MWPPEVTRADIILNPPIECRVTSIREQKNITISCRIIHTPGIIKLRAIKVRIRLKPCLNLGIGDILDPSSTPGIEPKWITKEVTYIVNDYAAIWSPYAYTFSNNRPREVILIRPSNHM